MSCYTITSFVAVRSLLDLRQVVSSAFLKDKAGLDVSSCKTNEEIMKRFRVNSEWKMKSKSENRWKFGGRCNSPVPSRSFWESCFRRQAVRTGDWMVLVGSYRTLKANRTMDLP